MKKNTLIAIAIAILSGIAVYVYQNQNNSSLKIENSDFAIKDTAAITKVFLADKQGNTVTLQRTDYNKWLVNEKYPARPDVIENLLEVINRVTVKTPVPKAAFETVVKRIAGRSTKVEIYLNNEVNPTKTYYVGGSDKDHSGTYMLLENSTVPFLIHMEGFKGVLSPRYVTNENVWRSTKIFDYEPGEIASIELQNIQNPALSFVITDNGDNTHSLFRNNINTNPLPYDTVVLRQYLALFRKVHFEGFEEVKSQQFIDSVKSSQPFYQLTVADKMGKIKTVKAYLKPAKPDALGSDGEPLTKDMDRFYAVINGNEFVVAQYYVFDPIFKDIIAFKPE